MSGCAALRPAAACLARPSFWRCRHDVPRKPGHKQVVRKEAAPRLELESSPAVLHRVERRTSQTSSDRESVYRALKKMYIATLMRRVNCRRLHKTMRRVNGRYHGRYSLRARRATACRHRPGYHEVFSPGDRWANTIAAHIPISRRRNCRYRRMMNPQIRFSRI